MHKRHFRALRPDVAIEQLKAFTGRYGVRGLFPTDANFFLDLDRARAILEGVVRESLDVVFTRLHIRFDTLRRLTDEDLKLFERAGVKCLAMGVESGSERIRALLRKPIDEGELHAVNARFRSSSIMPMYFFMIGFPTETRPELKATVDLFMRLAADNPRAYVSVNTYAPFPGTELFDLAVSEGLTPPARMEDWFSFSYRNLGANGAWLSDPSAQGRRDAGLLFVLRERSGLRDALQADAPAGDRRRQAVRADRAFPDAAHAPPRAD